MSERLWDLSAELLSLEAEIGDILDSELSPEEKDTRVEFVFKDYLATAGRFEDKAIATARFILHQEAIAKARKEEATRLKELAAKADNKAKRLKIFLAKAMESTGKTAIDGVEASLSLRKNPPSVKLLIDEEDVPPEFLRIKTVSSPNLTDIKAAIKKGDPLDWAIIQDGDRVLKIS